MAKDFFTDSTERTAATLESDGMRFLGAETGNENPVHTSYSSIKSAVMPDFILIRDTKTSGTNGGTFTAGADQTRDLTEITADPGGHATLSANQVTLDAGTYSFVFSAPAHTVNRHQAWLYNVSDSALVAAGDCMYNNTATFCITTSTGRGVFTITSSKTFEIRHRCEVTSSGFGFGIASNFASAGKEVYTQFELWKIA